MDREEVAHIIEDLCLIPRGSRLVVGVSGGPDSLCLADILSSLEYELYVAHLDHTLRTTSAADAELTAEFARARGLPFVLAREDTAAFAQNEGLSLEEAARIRRYRFLFEVASRRNARAVAVAHTADDQVETILMHLLRGAGLDGLSGMDFCSLPNPWSDEIPLVRPLLSTWRESVVEYLEERGIGHAVDETNLDTRFFRNRLRHELLPFLETYNPNIRASLWRMADILREDNAAFAHFVDTAWREVWEQEGDGWIALDRRGLLGQPKGIQRRLVRRGLAFLRPDLRDIDYATVERSLDYLKDNIAHGPIDLSSGLSLLREGDTVWFAEWNAELPHSSWPQVKERTEVELPIPGKVDLQGGWRLQAQIVSIGGGAPFPIELARENLDPYRAWLRLDALKKPLTIRSRRAGERMQPMGMGGHSVKLSDLMINARLPKRARRHWPLVLSDEEVAWAPGLHVGEPFRLTASDQDAVLLEVLKESQGSADKTAEP